MKTILITGSTDGIGLVTAQSMAADGNTIILHGRSKEKLATAADTIGGNVKTCVADLSEFSGVHKLAQQVAEITDTLDVLINNAGVLKAPQPQAANGLDLRFMVNTLAPYDLTKRLLPLLAKDGRILNLSSAAQAPVDLAALRGDRPLSVSEGYAQSKRAISVWSMGMAPTLASGQSVISVNPGSLLASKMVREGYGIAGHDIMIGVNILRELSFGDISGRNGAYYDNDSGRYAALPETAEDAAQLIEAIETIIAAYPHK